MSEQLATWKENLSPEEVARRERFGTAYNRLRSLNIQLSKVQKYAAQAKALEKLQLWADRDPRVMRGKDRMIADRITCTLILMLRIRQKATMRVVGSNCKHCGSCTGHVREVHVHAPPPSYQNITDELIHNFKLQEFLG